MKDNKVFIVGGHETLLSTEILKHLADKNIEVVDNIEQASSYVVTPPNLPQEIKEMSLYGAEKKKQKPCTYHEYTEHREPSETNENIIYSKWVCRHCGKVLQ